MWRIYPRKKLYLFFYIVCSIEMSPTETRPVRASRPGRPACFSLNYRSFDHIL